MITPLQDSDNRVVTVLDRLIFGLLIVFLFASAFSIALSEIGYFSAFVLWIGKMIYTKRNEIPSTPLDRFFLATSPRKLLRQFLRRSIFTRYCISNGGCCFFPLSTYLFRRRKADNICNGLSGQCWAHRSRLRCGVSATSFSILMNIYIFIAVWVSFRCT